MIRRICTFIALLLWVCWTPPRAAADRGADSLQIPGASSFGDTLTEIVASEAEEAAPDSLDSGQSQSGGVIRDLWIPLATVLAVGGVLLLLYTQRGN
jgi:hypothetical protein